MADPQLKQVNVELPNDLSAIYSNFAVVGRCASEVIVDFAQILPGPGAAKAHVRAHPPDPNNAKMLLQALGQNLANYEHHFAISGNQQDTFFDPKSGTLAA